MKKLGDYLIAFTQTYVEDEYEELMEHRSNTIFMWVVSAMMLVLGAVLAWALPGYYSMWSMVVALLPMVIANWVSKSWMKAYAPRPKPAPQPAYLGLTFFCTLMMVSGIGYNIEGGWGAFSVSALSGSVMGGFLGLFGGLAMQRRWRKKDIARLEAEMED